MDFDKLFESYARQWLETHKDAYESPEEMEAQIPALYDEWAGAPCVALNGLSPRAYFARITDAAELVGMLLTADEPSALLVERLAEIDGADDALRAVVTGDYDPEKKMTAMNLLNDRGVYPFDLYAGWLEDGTTDDELQELAVELMAEKAESAAALLYPLIDGADVATKTLLAEVLVNAPKDERTFKLLTELFASGNNIPLYAGYLGKYGDERAAGMLYRALDDCNYLEYLEIKNAIERMGGVVEDDRDFSDDVYYKAIKNLK